MGTRVDMSGGEAIHLTSETEGILAGVRDTLARMDRPEPHYGDAPNGFLRWHDASGQEVWVNVAQIAQIRPE